VNLKTGPNNVLKIKNGNRIHNILISIFKGDLSWYNNDPKKPATKKKSVFQKNV
jgi:hypothetical protein